MCRQPQFTSWTRNHSTQLSPPHGDNLQLQTASSDARPERIRSDAGNSSLAHFSLFCIISAFRPNFLAQPEVSCEKATHRYGLFFLNFSLAGVPSTAGEEVHARAGDECAVSFKPGGGAGWGQGGMAANREGREEYLGRESACVQRSTINLLRR